jgi:septal ring factor EnvC (AmiA/AmiB activator)
MSKLLSNNITLLLLSLFLFVGSGFAQSKKDLEKKKSKLQKDISYTNKLLEKTQKTKEANLQELNQLNKKIETRNELIKTINKELSLLDSQIKGQQDIIAAMEKDIEILKQEYAKLIYYAYKNRNAYNRVMFVFSSDDFNQAYKRLKYLQQYTNYRHQQADIILATKEKLENEILTLKAKKEEKQKLADEQKKENSKLSDDKQKQQSVVNTLSSKEKELRDELKEQQLAAKKLDDAIKKIIEEEIRKAREAAKKKNPSSTTPKDEFPLTPEAKLISNSFTANKGKLPWPVEQGVITGKYGEHPHPVLKQVMLKNNGIDISTSSKAIARSIFDGEVTSVVIIPGEGKAVFVRHGEYLSVYTYLSEVYVNKGDKVTTKQSLGKLLAEPGANSGELHLEIWQGVTKLNPEYWIYRK